MADDDGTAGVDELPLEDRLAIHELIALHGHLCDDGGLDRLGEVLADDVLYDVSAFGGEPLHGVDAVIAAGWALGDANPLAHHVTNTVVGAAGPDGVEVRSKALAVAADGLVSSLVYEDLVRRTPAGWRVVRRRIVPRRRPLHAG